MTYFNTTSSKQALHMPLKLRFVFGHGPKSKGICTFLLYTTARLLCSLKLEVKLSFILMGLGETILSCCFRPLIFLLRSEQHCCTARRKAMFTRLANMRVAFKNYVDWMDLFTPIPNPWKTSHALCNTCSVITIKLRVLSSIGF